jgi:hypothetical protein
LAASLHAQSLQPQHAHAQVVINSCRKETYLKLTGTVYQADQISVYVQWKAPCANDCGPLGVALDSLGNAYLPDESWGPGGIKCGEEICQMRLQTDADGSKATGEDTLHLPLKCPVNAEYGISVQAFNGTL